MAPETAFLPKPKRDLVRLARSKNGVMACTAMVIHPVAKDFVDADGEVVWTVTLLYNEGMPDFTKITLDNWMKKDGHRFSRKDAFRLAHTIAGHMYHGLPSTQIKTQEKPFHIEEYQQERLNDLFGKKSRKKSVPYVAPISQAVVGSASIVAAEEYYQHNCRECGGKITKRKGPGRPPIRCQSCAANAVPRPFLDKAPEACYDHPCKVCGGPIPKRKGPGRPPTKCPKH